MMGIVHGALLRDLARTRDVLEVAPGPVGGQREAVGRHVLWMMAFLHAHHTSEDDGLWPLVLSRNPAAAELLASLEDDHRLVAPAARTVSERAADYRDSTDDASRERLDDALAQLATVLEPHLEREVVEAMPVVERSITQAEWDDVERRFNLTTKSMRQLAMEGHWLLDGLDDEGRQVVVHLVPPLPRVVLVHGFARAYRRQARARWSPVAPRPRSVSR
jgi:hemerythrin-like domain-containing protein